MFFTSIFVPLIQEAGDEFEGDEDDDEVVSPHYQTIKCILVSNALVLALNLYC